MAPRLIQHSAMRRRSRYDPCTPVATPSWLVERDEHSRPLKITRLEPYADLRMILLQEQTRLLREGAKLEENDLTGCSSFFAILADGRRISIGISRSDPQAEIVDTRPEPWGGNVVSLKRPE